MQRSVVNVYGLFTEISHLWTALRVRFEVVAWNFQDFWHRPLSSRTTITTLRYQLRAAIDKNEIQQDPIMKAQPCSQLIKITKYTNITCYIRTKNNSKRHSPIIKIGSHDALFVLNESLNTPHERSKTGGVSPGFSVGGFDPAWANARYKLRK